MTLWSIIEAVLDIVTDLCNWRFNVCLLAGIALAFVAAGHISAEPLRWIVAGAILLAAIVIGWRWDADH